MGFSFKSFFRQKKLKREKGKNILKLRALNVKNKEPVLDDIEEELSCTILSGKVASNTLSRKVARHISEKESYQTIHHLVSDDNVASIKTLNNYDGLERNIGMCSQSFCYSRSGLPTNSKDQYREFMGPSTSNEGNWGNKYAIDVVEDENKCPIDISSSDYVNKTYTGANKKVILNHLSLDKLGQEENTSQINNHPNFANFKPYLLNISEKHKNLMPFPEVLRSDVTYTEQKQTRVPYLFGHALSPIASESPNESFDDIISSNGAKLCVLGDDSTQPSTNQEEYAAKIKDIKDNFVENVIHTNETNKHQSSDKSDHYRNSNTESNPLDDIRENSTDVLHDIERIIPQNQRAYIDLEATETENACDNDSINVLKILDNEKLQMNCDTEHNNLEIYNTGISDALEKLNQLLKPKEIATGNGNKTFFKIIECDSQVTKDTKSENKIIEKSKNFKKDLNTIGEVVEPSDVNCGSYCQTAPKFDSRHCDDSKESELKIDKMESRNETTNELKSLHSVESSPNIMRESSVHEPVPKICSYSCGDFNYVHQTEEDTAAGGNIQQNTTAQTDFELDPISYENHIRNKFSNAEAYQFLEQHFPFSKHSISPIENCHQRSLKNKLSSNENIQSTICDIAKLNTISQYISETEIETKKPIEIAKSLGRDVETQTNIPQVPERNTSHIMNMQNFPNNEERKSITSNPEFYSSNGNSSEGEVTNFQPSIPTSDINTRSKNLAHDGNASSSICSTISIEVKQNPLDPDQDNVLVEHINQITPPHTSMPLNTNEDLRTQRFIIKSPKVQRIKFYIKEVSPKNEFKTSSKENDGKTGTKYKTVNSAHVRSSPYRNISFSKQHKKTGKNSANTNFGEQRSISANDITNVPRFKEFDPNEVLSKQNELKFIDNPFALRVPKTNSFGFDLENGQTLLRNTKHSNITLQGHNYFSKFTSLDPKLGSLSIVNERSPRTTKKTRIPKDKKGESEAKYERVSNFKSASEFDGPKLSWYQSWYEFDSKGIHMKKLKCPTDSNEMEAVSNHISLLSKNSSISRPITPISSPLLRSHSDYSPYAQPITPHHVSSLSDLNRIFTKKFRWYTSIGRHCGELILISSHMKWMRDAGIVGEILTAKEASLAFRSYAGCKLMLNRQDYKNFLKELSQRKKIPYNYILHQMCQ